ncbi:MAG: methionine biosynthesis protein MetW [Proteobacteria bacterium]|nr:methionine biosynthesis protein MetW [Pseudomonadota bacterium]
MASYNAPIAALIPSGSSAIDIGCGEGELIHLLENKSIKVKGLEIDAAKVSAAISHGLSVVQGDADHDLKHYPDAAFDYAILAKTLQATKQPKQVLVDLLRVAKHVVVVIPNFGYWKNRLYLLTKGRMPVTSTLSYQWYETPNIHFCTLRDFVTLVGEIGAVIESRAYIDSAGKVHPFLGASPRANLLGESALFVLTKK